MGGTQNFEQQVSFYHSVFLYCAMAAAVFLAFSLVLFFFFRIPHIFGELSGRNARRAISQMTGGTAGEPAVSAEPETEKLGDRVTDVLYRTDASSTESVYQAPETETSLLNPVTVSRGEAFTILRSIVVVHTEETVET